MPRAPKRAIREPGFWSAEPHREEQHYVALLRGINVGGRTSMPMADLRDACTRAGLGLVRTYIQSGNLLLTSAAPASVIEETVEAAIVDRFDRSVPVIARSRADWSRYLAANPFQDESEVEPKLVMIGLSKHPRAREAVAILSERAADGERITEAGGALWFYFRQGAGSSRLTPSFLDRTLGSPVTLRNWRTVVRLGEMLDEDGTEER